MWKIILSMAFLLPALGQEAEVLKIEYQRVEKTVMDTQTEIQCHLSITNQSSKPLANVRLILDGGVNAAVNNDLFDFGLILPKAKSQSPEIFVFSYDNDEEPPRLVWMAEVLRDDGLTETVRIE